MTGDDPEWCFSFYDAADLAPPEHEIELLWRIEGSLKNALTLLAELRPATAVHSLRSRLGAIPKTVTMTANSSPWAAWKNTSPPMP